MIKLSTINILITGIGSAGLGEQIIKALKLSELDIFIVGTDLSEFSFNKYNVDKFIIIPTATSPEYGTYISEIIDKYKIDILFPGSEAELMYFSSNIQQFNNVNIPINDSKLINLCLNKYTTYKKISEMGIEVPKFNKIDSVNDCKYIDYFPVVLKPNTGSGGSAHVYIAFDKDELIMFAKYMLKYGIDVIAQEYIEYNDNEYTIGVSSNEEGVILGSIILKRLLNNSLSINKKIQFKDKSVIISSGISQGSFIVDENIKVQAENIAKLLNSKGPLNIQARLRSDKLMLMEINPRLSGTTYLRALAGYNEPLNMIKNNILGQTTEYNYSIKTILRSVIEKINS